MVVLSEPPRRSHGLHRRRLCPSGPSFPKTSFGVLCETFRARPGHGPIFRMHLSHKDPFAVWTRYAAFLYGELFSRQARHALVVLHNALP